MNDQKDPKKQPQKQTSREDRLKAALKANLGRRKAQARTRTGAKQENSSQSDK